MAIRETPGSIDYLDAGHGRNQAGLGEVSLRNAAGAHVTSSDLAASKGLEQLTMLSYPSTDISGV